MTTDHDPARLLVGPVPVHPPHESARWIWLPQEHWPGIQFSAASPYAPQVNAARVCTFTKTFQSDGAESGLLVVTADTRHRTWLNGVAVANGPTRPGGDWGNAQSPDWWFYDEFDVARELIDGDNTLVVEVVLGPTRDQDYSVGHGGLLVDLVLNGERNIVSDASWDCRPSARYTGTTSMGARRAELEPWQKADVLDDQRAWRLHPSGLHALYWDRVNPREIVSPFADQASRILGPDAEGAITLLPGGPITFWADFGRIHAGHIALDIEAAPGTLLQLQCQEVIGRTDINGEADQVTCGDEPLRYRGLELRSSRYLRVTVAASDRQTRIGGIWLDTVSYFGEPVASVHTGDAELDAIHDASVWTERLCAQTMHLDSPVHQEGLGVVGDYLIEALIDYRSYGDASLVRADIARIARLLRQKSGVMFHTSYSLLWIDLLLQHFMHTDDAELVRECIDCVDLLIGRFTSYLGASGIIEHAPDYLFIDHVEVGEFTLHHPPKSIGQGAMTAFFVESLRKAALLYRAVGDDESAGEARLRAEEVAASFRRALWRPERGLFADGLPEGPADVAARWLPSRPDPADHFTAHTNVLAIRAGIPAEEHARDLLKRVLTNETLPTMQPYFLHFVFDAIDDCGLTNELSLAILRRFSALIDEVPGSLKEVWSGFDCDYSHAWGGTPVFQLSARILGVEPAEPGFRTTRIAPALGDLDRVEGTVPTPFGGLRVTVARVEGGVRVEADVPAGVSVQISGTRMYEREPAHQVDATAKRRALSYLIPARPRPEKAADAADHLVNPRSQSTTGASIAVDGGIHNRRFRPATDKER